MKGKDLSGLLATFFVLTLTLSLTLFVSQGQAAIPQQINYQGYLTNAAGVPVNSTVNMSFRIYGVSTGGTSLWTETQNNVPVTQGVYNVILGSQAAIALSFDVPYFLEIEIGGEVLSPRKAITSVGYAFRALTVESVGIHTHSGADITSGIVAEPMIDSAIARTSALNAHTSNMNNPHSTTAAQVGAVALNQTNSITSAMIVDGTIMNADISATAAIDISKLSGVASSSHLHDTTYVNEGQINSISTEMIQTGAVTSEKVTAPLSLSGATTEGIIEGRNDGSGWPATGVLGISTGSNGIAVRGNALAIGPNFNYGGYFLAEGDSGTGVHGSASGAAGIGVRGYAYAIGPVTNLGGIFTANGDTGRGVVGESNGAFGMGVQGSATATGPVINYGGSFSASGDSGIGVSGRALAYGGWFSANGNSGTGIYASAPLSGVAGFFDGNVVVTGTLSKGAGSFKIDHPLEPENKYLSHSFVESPVMKNIYDGLAMLDDKGEAWVMLPEWFEALNKDFRYQLTCIGGYAPVYVAEKVSNNRFKIGGGKSGMEVSWQVTGIRKDPFANAHRIPVEEQKMMSDRGYYLHPEAYSQPKEKSIEWAKDRGNKEMLAIKKEEGKKN